MRRNHERAIIAILVSCVLLVACKQPTEAQKKGGQTAAAEQNAVQTGFNRLSNTQPIPQFDFSQERQTLINAQTIRAKGIVTTTTFLLEGVGLMQWCPSIGAPVPSTYQLSGSQQYVDLPNDDSRTRYPVDQGEPTGVYVGASNGTWVICTDDKGNGFGKYWEGPVDSTVGVVAGLPPEKRVKVDQITFEFKKK